MNQLPSLIILNIFLWILSVQSTTIQAEQWLFIKEKHGVKAYKKHIPNSTLYTFKGEGIIPQPIEKVVALLLDNQSATQWIPKLISCKELSNNNQWPKSFMQFSLFDAPWPLKDRYFFSRIDVQIRDNGNTVIIDYEDIAAEAGLKEVQPPVKAILGELSGSEYTLKRLDDGKTYFSAISAVRPNGKIPNWLLNWVGSSMPFDSFIRMNQELTKSQRPVPAEIINLLNAPKATAHPSVGKNRAHL